MSDGNGHFPGLVLGQQTIEKLLKSYLLFADPNRNTKKLSHDLETLAKEVVRQYPNLVLLEYAEILSRFQGHYQARYPDNPDAPRYMSTGELESLDRVVVFLNENLPCPRNIRCRTGLYAHITLPTNPNGFVPPWKRWSLEANNFLAPLMPRTQNDHATVMREMYPGQHS